MPPQEKQALTIYELWVRLIGEVQQDVEPITAAGDAATVAEVQATLEAAGELLRGLNHA